MAGAECEKCRKERCRKACIECLACQDWGHHLARLKFDHVWIIFLVVWSMYWVNQARHLEGNLKLSEWGDFWGGIFGPPALFFVALSYLKQRESVEKQKEATEKSIASDSFLFAAERFQREDVRKERGVILARKNDISSDVTKWTQRQRRAAEVALHHYDTAAVLAYEKKLALRDIWFWRRSICLTLELCRPLLDDLRKRDRTHWEAVEWLADVLSAADSPNDFDGPGVDREWPWYDSFKKGKLKEIGETRLKPDKAYFAEIKETWKNLSVEPKSSLSLDLFEEFLDHRG